MKSFLLPERWKREAFFIYATTDQSPLLRKILFSIVPLLLGVPTTQQQGTFRKQCLWDSGKVPLGLRATARDEKKMMQLASLRQVSPLLQRSHPRAKRKPDPRIMHSCPEAHRWEMVGSQIMVTIMGNNLLVEPEEVCYNGGS